MPVSPSKMRRNKTQELMPREGKQLINRPGEKIDAYHTAQLRFDAAKKNVQFAPIP